MGNFTLPFFRSWRNAWRLRQLLKNGAPYVGTPFSIVSRMIELAELSPQDHVVDLGSGDGRLLFAAARAGVREAIGIEINPLLARWSEQLAIQQELSAQIRILEQDFWQTDLSGTSVVFVYQLPNVMERLGEKLRQELAPGARVIAHGSFFPSWEPDRQEGNLYRYIIPPPR